MKIVHVCLANFYVEGWGYQENLLPKFHAFQGNDVTIIASDYMFNQKYEATTKPEKDYYNKYGFHVIVLDRDTQSKYRKLTKKFKAVYETLCSEKPDVIFVHGGQTSSLKEIVAYCKKNKNVKLYVDNHGDYYNTPVNTFKRKLWYGIVVGHYFRKAKRYVARFWGTTPWRCEYLHEVYGLPNKKIGLLVMGGDDERIDWENKTEIRNEIRAKLNLSEDDFVLITGGKIDETKNIHRLMKAVGSLDNEKIKLIVFGQPNDKMKDTIESLSQNPHVRNIGWLDSNDVYDYYLASDVAVFPGTHSVLWEQACACGLPLIVKNWQGMHHVDLGGNCVFVSGDDEEELAKVVSQIYGDKKKCDDMKSVAEGKGRKEFAYSEIAKRAIGIND